MRIKEIYEILQKKKNEKVTQSDISRAIGTSRANVSKLFAKNSFINDDKIKKIEEYFGVTFNESDDLFYMDYYPDSIVELKNGKYRLGDKKVKFKVPYSFLNIEKDSKYIMCNAQDDSMFPSIKSGDFLIIKVCKKQEIYNNKVHIFMYDGTFYVRRLVKNINEIMVKAENPEFNIQTIKKDEIKNLDIIGIVVNVIRSSSRL